MENQSTLFVSASRSPPDQAPKRLSVWSSFAQSRGSLVLFRIHLSIVGSTLGALGPSFSGQKRSGLPKVPQEAPPPKSFHCWGGKWNMFDLLGYVFFSSRIDFLGFSLYVDTLCLTLFHTFRFIPFENLFLKCPRAFILTHFQYALSTSFQVSFSIRCS